MDEGLQTRALLSLQFYIMQIMRNPDVAASKIELLRINGLVIIADRAAYAGAAR